MRIAVAGDHAGFHLKKEIVRDLRDRGIDTLELGAFELDPKDDYPDFAVELAAALRGGRADRGVLVCGSGVGVCIAVNKHPGLRAGVCHDTYSSTPCGWSAPTPAATRSDTIATGPTASCRDVPKKA